MKRTFDFISSMMAIIILSPLIVIIALIVKLTSSGPILFKQRRMGKDNKEFNIYKFRTMRTDTPDVATHLLENPEQYITKIGRFMRKTSLDELPQLFNILKGEMSVVGPRPALYNQDDLIRLRIEKEVHKLVPGLTGWAQINGRDEIPIPQKVELDAKYIEIMGFWMDIKIILMTISSVVKSEGVSEGKAKNEKGVVK